MSNYRYQVGDVIRIVNPDKYTLKAHKKFLHKYFTIAKIVEGDYPYVITTYAPSDFNVCCSSSEIKLVIRAEP